VHSKSRLSALVLVFAAILCIAYPAFAQQTLGGITGTVVDPGGSAIPGVEVTATSDQTKLVRTTTSSATGSYEPTRLRSY
jgi:hypothetical protein